MPTRTILVAEDFTAFRQYVCDRLRERPDFQVVPVADGLAAVRAAEDLQPDVALLDIGLPALNGIAVAKDIRAHCPQSRVVFLTQESSPEIVDAARDLGADGYILKTRTRYMMPLVEAILADGPRPNGHSHGTRPEFKGPRQHDVHFYANDSALVDSAERFVLSRLATHDAAIVALTKPRLDALAVRLRRRQSTIDRAIEQGTFLTIDAAVTVAAITASAVTDWDGVRQSWRDVLTSAATATGRAHPRVAAFSETAALLLAARHLEAAMALEQEGEDLLATPELPTLDLTCVYPVLPVNDGFKTICAAHSMVAVH